MTLIVGGTVRQRMVNILVERLHEGVEVQDLIQLVYAGQEAPPSARNCINVMAHEANVTLRRCGWQITATKGRGSRYQIRVLT